MLKPPAPFSPVPKQVAAAAGELRGFSRHPRLSSLPPVQVADEAEKVHGTFMAMTQQLMTGELESNLFEDQVGLGRGAGGFRVQGRWG